TRLTGTGRDAKLESIPGSEFRIECDMVVKALGQVALTEFLSAVPGLRVQSGRVLVDKPTGATGVNRLFAGGDCVSKGAEVVDAVQDGKLAAAGIEADLKRA